MTTFLNSLFISASTRLHSEEKGQALTEYALVLAVVVVGAVAAMIALRDGIGAKITSLVASL